MGEMDYLKMCRSCRSGSLTQVLDLGSHYLSDFTEDGESPHPAVPLTLLLCEGCGLAQLSHSAPREWMYQEYWYRSGTNPAMVAALQDVVGGARMHLRDGLEAGDTVIDIGANDGTLLAQYPLLGHSGLHRIGWDPAGNLHSLLQENCEELVGDFFPCERGKWVGGELPSAAIITSIAMFYDLEDPLGFAREVGRFLSPGGVWVIQVGDLRSMVEQNAFDAICHEHLEYWSLTSLFHLLKRAGFLILGVERNAVNGGSLRVYAGPLGTGAKISAWDANRMMGELVLEERARLKERETYQRLQERVWQIAHLVKKTVHQAVFHLGPVDLYGASTKGNTLLQLFGLAHPEIRWAIERSPAKWGKKTVGTKIPIVSEEQGRAGGGELGVAPLWLVGPWHFREGILERERAYLKEGGILLFPLPWPEAVGRGERPRWLPSGVAWRDVLPRA